MTSPGSGRVARRAGIVAAFTLLSRVFGYFRDAALAYAFGAGVAFDAFVAAQTIPNVFRRLVAEGTLTIAYVPLLAAEEKEHGLSGMRRFTSAVLGLLIPVLVVLVGLGVAVPEVLVEAFASGFDRERAALAARLTRIMMPFLFFVSLLAVSAGALNARGVFAPSAGAPVLLNLSIILMALGATAWFSVPIEAAAWGVVLGGVLQLGLQVPFLVRTGMWVRPRWRPRDPALQLLLRRMGPAVFGVGVYQLNLIVIRQIASYLPQGQLSCYFYGTRLEEFALGVFAVSISVAALPTLSQHAAAGDLTAFRRVLKDALRATNFITIPSMVGLGVLATPIVSVLFQRGAFSAFDAALTASLLQIMALALVPIGLVRVLVPAYYAVGDTVHPVRAALASLLVTTGLGLALQHSLEIVGLTIATTVASIGQLTVLVLSFERRVGSRMHEASTTGTEEPLALLGHALRCAIAIAPWGAAAYWGARRVDWLGGEGTFAFRAAVLAGLIGVSAAGYLVTTRALGIGEAVRLWRFLMRRLGR